jgi:plastocyanin
VGVADSDDVRTFREVIAMAVGSRAFWPVRWRSRNHIWACVASLAGLIVGTGLALPAPVLAGAGITITSGGCSGGGTAFCYLPESATAVAGTPVTWTNSTSVTHTITRCTPSACAGNGGGTGAQAGFGDANLSPGTTYTFTFAAAGTYVYYCAIHGYAAMHGTITITAATSPTPTPAPSPRHTSNGGPASTPSTGADAAPGLLLLVFGVILALLTIGIRRLRSGD